jgi:hypothetical protein
MSFLFYQKLSKLYPSYNGALGQTRTGTPKRHGF